MYVHYTLQGPCGAAQPSVSLVFSLEGDNETMQPNFRGIRCQAGRLPWCVAILGVERGGVDRWGDRRLETCRACFGGRQALPTEPTYLASTVLRTLHTKDRSQRQIAGIRNGCGAGLHNAARHPVTPILRDARVLYGKGT